MRPLISRWFAGVIGSEDQPAIKMGDIYIYSHNTADTA